MRGADKPSEEPLYHADSGSRVRQDHSLLPAWEVATVVLAVLPGETSLLVSIPATKQSAKPGAPLFQQFTSRTGKRDEKLPTPCPEKLL